MGILVIVIIICIVVYYIRQSDKEETKKKERMSEAEELHEELSKLTGPPTTSELAKDLLKYTGKEIGYTATELVDVVTLGIPKAILEKHVQKKIMERQFPHLSSLPRKDQSWHRLKLGSSENEVGWLLGLPLELNVIDIQEKRKQNWEYKYDKSWRYNAGAVYFKNEIVVAFWYESARNETIEEGFPTRTQIPTPIPQPTTPPCPYCGNPLSTPLAKQCFSCHMDWHNPNNVIKHNV